ncbi:hypothetical protein KI387_042011 [Taxus chinensis]|uniref:Symplekin/Pta1 N-terminal domain-containing protein n=1 Tax=Taxus chinensis TaxID=29808 RepID=A0AA38C5J4_TAXCH|nr:hypothetical protein KI387_042011 [Taxus chinensis]
MRKQAGSRNKLDVAGSGSVWKQLETSDRDLLAGILLIRFKAAYVRLIVGSRDINKLCTEKNDLLTLSSIAKKRPVLFGRVLPVFLGLAPSCVAVSGAQVTGVQNTLKNAFVGFIKSTNPGAIPEIIMAARDTNMFAHCIKKETQEFLKDSTQCWLDLFASSRLSFVELELSTQPQLQEPEPTLMPKHTMNADEKKACIEILHNMDDDFEGVLSQARVATEVIDGDSVSSLRKWRDRLVDALKAMNAGDLAEQALRQVEKMVRNSEHSLCESSSEQKASSQAYNMLAGEIGKRRTLVQETVSPATIDDKPGKRIRHSSPALQQFQPSSDVINESEPSNGNNPGSLMNGPEMTPVQQLVAMFGAIVAQGDRAVESLEILISRIPTDLLAEVVIANMHNLPSIFLHLRIVMIMSWQEEVPT